MSRRCLRLASNPGVEGIELMLEIRERLFQISQFFRAGIPNHTMLPRRGCQSEAPRRGSKTGGRAHQVHATHLNVLTVARPLEGGLATATSCWT
jgi:hypothetical protein